MLFHFSEDPHIDRFVPHVPRTNPTQQPAVWAIDGAHAPLYWFPRQCPRVTVWPRDETERATFEKSFSTTATRLHAIEDAWLDAMRTTSLYRYDFAEAGFESWAEATGQWVCFGEVAPIAVTPVGDLLDLHAAAHIELRLVPSLWPLHDRVVNGPWEFSIVRIHNARPR